MILAGADHSGDEKDAEGKEGVLEIKCWLQWYLALEDHDFFVEIEREYIMDQFNLIKLRESCGS